LEDDVMALLTKHMRERGQSFKEAVNSLLRQALRGDRVRTDISFPAFEMGVPEVELAHALRLAHDMEDEEHRRDLEVGR
jgi:hypothetical protein